MTSLTDRDARHLATAVAKQSDNVLVKFGRTNGRNVLHLRKVADDERASLTIASAAEWAHHPWNRENAPKKPKEDDNQ